MAFKITANSLAGTFAAGEPIPLVFVDCNKAGTPLSLTGRAYVFVVYNAKRKTLAIYNGYVNPSDNQVYWNIDGTLSNRLYGETDMSAAIIERLDNGHYPIISGPLTITISPVGIEDFDEAPISRHMTRIKRTNDPLTNDDPVFTISRATYSNIPAATIPVSFGGGSGGDGSSATAMLDYSNPESAMLMAAAL